MLVDIVLLGCGVAAVASLVTYTLAAYGGDASLNGPIGMRRAGPSLPRTPQP